MELNRIYNEDCLGVMRRMESGSVDLVVTDPPYLIDYKTNRRIDKDHKFSKVIANDNDPEFIKEYIKECYRIMKDNTAMYMFCSFDKVDFFKKELERYFNVKNMIVWVKNNWTSGDLTAQFGKKYEIIFLVNKGRKEFSGKRLSDVWDFKRIPSGQLIHQNQKPIALIERCVVKHSEENAVVFDGCAGSGTLAEACINTNRNYICCEINKEYYDVAVERIKKRNMLIPLF